jgi:putative ABC transport system ATP-binding protein
VILLEDLHKSYALGKTEVEALRGVNLELAAGDFAAIAGPSGSGKTTLMNILGLIDTPSSGRVVIEGVETGKAGTKELVMMRRERIGFVFQSFNLLSVLNVYENVELPLLLEGRKGRLSRKERRERVSYLLEEVGLSERKGHKPGELSGGQMQRAAIARALVRHPGIVLADEPTANLDSINGGKILELMQKIHEEEGTTFIFSTHDRDIWGMANRVIFLRDGRVEREERKGCGA